MQPFGSFRFLRERTPASAPKHRDQASRTHHSHRFTIGKTTTQAANPVKVGVTNPKIDVGIIFQIRQVRFQIEPSLESFQFDLL